MQNKSAISKYAKKIALYASKSANLYLADESLFYKNELLPIHLKYRIMAILNKASGQFDIIEDIYEAEFNQIMKITCEPHDPFPHPRESLKRIIYEEDSIDLFEINVEISKIFEKLTTCSKSRKLFAAVEYELKNSYSYKEYYKFFKLLLIIKIIAKNELKYFDYFIYRLVGTETMAQDEPLNKLVYIGFSKGDYKKRFMVHLATKTTKSKLIFDTCDSSTIFYTIIKDLSCYAPNNFNMKAVAALEEEQFIKFEDPYELVNNNGVRSDNINCEICGKALKVGSLKAHMDKIHINPKTEKKSRNKISK